jgi:hypothetical protein
VASGDPSARGAEGMLVWVASANSQTHPTTLPSLQQADTHHIMRVREARGDPWAPRERSAGGSLTHPFRGYGTIPNSEGDQ